MIQLETARLLLREWNEASDLAPMCEFYADAASSGFVGGPRDPEVVWRAIASYMGHYQLRGYSYWAIEEISSGDFVGASGLWNSAEWPEMELGYYIIPAKQGQGFATEAARKCQEFAFRELNNETLVSYINKENTPSKRVAKRLGGIFDGLVELAHFGPHEVYRYKPT